MEDLSTYNSEGSELRNVQLRLLEALKVLDRICRDNKIEYCLAGGSVLGAVRHKGFIPWDDDIDIILFPGEYKKLLKVLSKEKYNEASLYGLQWHKGDYNYIEVFPKFREKLIGQQCEDGKNYVLGDNPLRAIKYKYKGVSIDIFCLEKNSMLTNKLSLICRHFFLVKLYRIDNNYVRSIMTRVSWFAFCVSIIVIKLLFNFLRKKDFRGYKEWHYKAGSPAPEHKTYKEDIFPLRMVSFESLLVPIPNNYDSYLRNLYGDYMIIPENKKTHTKSLRQ